MSLDNAWSSVSRWNSSCSRLYRNLSVPNSTAKKFECMNGKWLASLVAQSVWHMLLVVDWH